MYKFYENIVPFKLAVKLEEIGYTKNTGYQYDADGHLVDPAAPGGVSGICEAPTYSETIDFLLNKGIFIELTPYFTYALITRCGFSYTISIVKKDEGIKREGWSEFGSFNVCMDCAIERAIEIFNQSKLDNNL